MKDEKSGVAIVKCVGLKSKMCSFPVDDSGEHKKAIVFATISHNEYENI